MDDGGLPLNGSIHCLQGAYINCNFPKYSSYDIYTSGKIRNDQIPSAICADIPTRDGTMVSLMCVLPL